MNSKRHVRNRRLDICHHVYVSDLLLLANPIFCDTIPQLSYLRFGVRPSRSGKTKQLLFRCPCLCSITKVSSGQFTSTVILEDLVQQLLRYIIDIGIQCSTFHYLPIPFLFAWFSFHKVNVSNGYYSQLRIDF